MSADPAPFGLRCIYHPSGEPRIATLTNGVASGYATALYSGTPVKIADNGTLVATDADGDVTIGIFVGCFFISNGRPFQLSYWPAGQTYDALTVMWAQYEAFDPKAIYEAQADSFVNQDQLGESINLASSSIGSPYTGQSTQFLNAVTTGATPGTFIVENIAPYPDNSWGDDYTIVRVRISSFAVSVEWPLPGALMDFDFISEDVPQLWSGSLGEVTATQAFTSVWSTGGLVFDGDGKLQSFGANTVPIGARRGMWAQTTGSCRIDFNNALSNAAWAKTNVAIVQDLPSPFRVGTPAGWRVTASADGGTITQDYLTITPSGSITMSLPHAMFYWDGTPLQGAVEITNDDFVTVLDISDQLVAGQWVQIGGTPVDLPDPPVTETMGIRFAKAGDSVGFCLANVQRGYVMTTPILTPSNSTVNNVANVTTINTANFPPIWNLSQFTILVVCEPQMKPLPPVGDPDLVRTGWTVLEINNPYNLTMTGTGNLVPYGGPGAGSLMTVDAAAPGFAAAVDNRMTVGSGVGNYTDITEQLTSTEGGGALGGAGTYRVFSILYPDGQTTPSGIVLQSRVKNAMGYGLNAALKPDDEFAQRIGLTITNELEDVSYGFDPQTEDYIYNVPNSEGFSLDTDTLFGIIALRGDIEQADNGPGHYTAAPVLASDIVINLGSQYPSGGPLDGVIQRVVVLPGTLTSDQLAAYTVLLQRWVEAQ